MNKMVCLNDFNGASKYLEGYARRCLNEFKSPLFGVNMGIAYGGEVAMVGKIWKDRGMVFGYDTFEGKHPKFLADDPDSPEAYCMDEHYDIFGTSKLSLKYQNNQLKKMGINNVKLIKGLVNKDSCKDLPYINYAFLDMDILESMKTGFEAIRHKLIKGGYLMMHDVVPHDHLNGVLYNYFMPIFHKDDKNWEILQEVNSCFLVVLRKISDG